VELEKRKFEFEVAKWQAEKDRQAIKDQEEKIYRDQMLIFQQETLDRQNDDRKKRDTVVFQVKVWGDAMRNAAIRMGQDPMDLPPFFDHVERLFRDLEVPSNLRVQIIRPYFNEKAKALITRLSTESVSDYEFVKRYLLDQFELSPRVYLEHFNTMTCQPGETATLFTNRLLSCLQRYTVSRQVKDFDSLISLLIADRVKSSLSEPCLRYILSIEATTDKGWLDHSKLAKSIDTYNSNHPKDKPLASAIGRNGVPAGKRFIPATRSFSTPQSSSHMSLNSSNSVADDKPARQVAHVGEGGGKECFHCKSRDHLVRACPLRATTGRREGEGRETRSAQYTRPGGGAKVSKCTAAKMTSYQYRY